MKKKIGVLIFVFALITLLSFDSLTIAHAENKKVIRVGYPLIGNVSQKDEDGNYYGYDYEFLKQIAQYTGWEYEFVEVEGDLNTRLVTLLTMLQNGEIDLLGSMTYSDSLANVYDYASEPYGYSYEVLAVKNESNIYDQNALIARQNLRIAVHEKSASKSEKLNQFSKMNNFTYEEIRSTDNGMYDLLNNDKVDAVLTNDMTIPDGYRIVARFFPEPFYFATTKGNSELVSQLNQALISIAESNPTFESTLYNRYFSAGNQDFILNNEEKEFVSQHKTMKVLVRDGQAPVQYTDGSTIKGVAKDILDIIEKETDITFEYTIAKSYEEFETLNASGDYDILIGLPYEMTVAETFDVTLSNTFVSGNLTLVTHNSVDPNHLENYIEGKTPYTFKDYNTLQRVNSKAYETPEEILLAINQSEVQYTYLNSYIATYYISKNNLKNVSTFTVPDYLKSQYSYGIKKTDDFTLLGILNKAINSVDNEINSIIYKNASVEKEFTFMTFVQENLAIFLISILAIVVAAIYIIHRYYKHQLLMKRAVELEYKRYQMLYDITGEMTFSYDYLQDILKISRSGLNKIADEQNIDNFSKLKFDEEEKEQILYVIHQYLMNQEDVNCEAEFTLVNAEKNWYQLTIKLVSDTDKSSHQAVYAIGKVLDIQKDIIEKEKLKQSNITDALTGIYNRVGAHEEIDKKLKESSQHGALIMMDLDNFKEVNDQYGHLEGDVVLQQTADMLKKVFHESIIARLGGDEFIIYIDNTNIEIISQLCEEALRSIEKLPYIKEKNIHMTMSMGVVFDDESRDFSTLMRIADEQMYIAKRDGKNGFHIFSNK